MLEKFRSSLLAALAVATVALGGCAKEQEILSVQELLAKGQQQEDAADYESAVATYEELQASFPFGGYAQQALLNLTHMHFTQRVYEQAQLSAEKFIRDYPSSNNLDYAYYLRAVALQRDRVDLLAQVILASTGNRSRADLLLAYEAFQDLISRYPDSIYTPDAIDRLNAVVNQLANSDLRTGIHYFRLGAYAAAIRRSSQVITTYPDSDAGELALAIMVASLVEIQAEQPLRDALASLRSNYPDSNLTSPAQAGADALLTHLRIKRSPGDYFTYLLERGKAGGGLSYFKESPLNPE